MAKERCKSDALYLTTDFPSDQEKLTVGAFLPWRPTLATIDITKV